MPIHARGFRLRSTRWGLHGMLGRIDVLDQANTLAAVVDDLYWDSTPTPTTIDYTWIIQPVAFRLDPPINDVSVTDGSNNSARRFDLDSIAEFGTKLPASGYQLATEVPADADCLAAHVIEYYAVPPPDVQRQRCSQITIDLFALTPDQQATVLGIDDGDRIVIANTPSTWPAGADSLIVEGRANDIGVSRRRLTLNTSPVIGSSLGEPGPYFRWGTSVWGSTTDLIPF
jgi:hypothetical protein